MSRPDSIIKIGLRNHLDSTADAHKGKRYKDLVEMVENRASNNYIARAFGVNKNTISKWLVIHDSEQKEKQAKTVQ
jgi:hypothetical protein